MRRSQVPKIFSCLLANITGVTFGLGGSGKQLPHPLCPRSQGDIGLGHLESGGKHIN